MKLGFKDEPNFSFRDMARAILYLLGDQKKKYLFYSCIFLSLLMYELVPIYIIGKIVDFFTLYKHGESLKVFYFYIVFLVVGNVIVSQTRISMKLLLVKIKSLTTFNTKVKGFDRLLGFSLRWHDSESTGNKVQRIQNGTNSFNDMQETFYQGIFQQLANFIGVSIACLFIKPILLLYMFVYISIFLSIQISFYKQSLKLNNLYNTMTEKASGTFYEGLSNVLSIKTLGVKDDFKANVISSEELARDYQMRMAKLGNNKWKMFQIINSLTLGGVLFLTGRGFVDGVITLGSIFIIYNYFQRLSNTLGESTVIFEKMITAKVSLARMMPIFWDDEGVKQGTQVFPSRWENITLKDASFNYQNSEQKELDSGLQNLTLKINKFEKIGVVGRSGSGKSTFAKLLLGLYQFKSGGFKIGNVDFYDIKHENITNEVALVLQDSEMFNLSLKENITLMRTFDEALFERATDIAQLDELIKVLPSGIETIIGEKGYRLSGGERQRIGIARAIYKDPEILVLDEATSSLDTQTESKIQEAFEKNLKEKTIISIAHRVSTLKNVDRILVFENGSVVEEGTFAALSSNPDSKFSQISKYQSENSSN